MLVLKEKKEGGYEFSSERNKEMKRLFQWKRDEDFCRKKGGQRLFWLKKGAKTFRPA